MSNFQSLVFYIVAFTMSALLYKAYCKYNKKILLLGAFAIPLLIGGLRYNVGTDYPGYLEFYKYKNFVDPGFFVISSIARLFDNSQIIFFIYNALTLLFVFSGLNIVKKGNRPLAYFCFLFLFFTSGFNTMRQMLAVSIVFFAYRYALNKKAILFTVFVAFASLFHVTALFGLIIYPLLYSNKKIYKIIVSIIALAMVVGYQNIIAGVSDFATFEHFSIYQDYKGDSFSNISFFFELLVLVYLMLFYKKAVREDERVAKLTFIYVVGIIFLSTGFFSPFVKRIALYFTITSITLLPVIPFSCKSGKDKLLNQAIIVILVVAKFIIQSYFLGQADIIPYNVIGF